MLCVLRFSANVMLACTMAMMCAMNYRTDSESEEEEELASMWKSFNKQSK